MQGVLAALALERVGWVEVAEMRVHGRTELFFPMFSMKKKRQGSPKPPPVDPIGKRKKGRTSAIFEGFPFDP